MPAGTCTGLPSTKTSRCACVCVTRNSRVVGSKPASCAWPIGSDGAGQRGCARGVLPHATTPKDRERITRAVDRCMGSSDGARISRAVYNRPHTQPPMAKPCRVVLIGMMGTGTTTVGRLLAGHTGWPYADNDELLLE